MKKIGLRGLIMITLLALFTNVQAQQKAMASAEDRAAKLTDWMKTNLKLTDAQVPQVQAVNLKYANKMNDLHNNTAQTKDQKMEAMKADMEAKDGELKNILTPDQYKTYVAKKDELKKQMKEKMEEKK